MRLISFSSDVIVSVQFSFLVAQFLSFMMSYRKVSVTIRHTNTTCESAITLHEVFSCCDSHMVNSKLYIYCLPCAQYSPSWQHHVQPCSSTTNDRNTSDMLSWQVSHWHVTIAHTVIIVSHQTTNNIQTINTGDWGKNRMRCQFWQTLCHCLLDLIVWHAGNNMNRCCWLGWRCGMHVFVMV